jgi:hypothetical protein
MTPDALRRLFLTQTKNFDLIETEEIGMGVTNTIPTIRIFFFRRERMTEIDQSSFIKYQNHPDSKELLKANLPS